ncbi:hypothetical protein BMS3Abin07_00868 [bacterium BMS3Abin07]|nr:hypothetical protein BMS3Abin07_00868 [bacterium BMS3Abin07]GBE31662.1 hypothetical protein BMS3Bbin05_00565 [bacterium BMS3Bbin05]
MTSRAGNKGFTLIELILVLLIMGLASSIVIVSISKASGKATIRYEARRLYSALSHAREVAISRHSEITFKTVDENKGYLISANNANVYDRRLPKTITISAEKVVFFPFGNSTGGTILLSDKDGRKYEITVSNITGKASVRRIQSP